MCRALSNLGLIQYDKLHYDSALFYFNQVMSKLDADTLATEQKDYILTGLYNNLALLYMDQNEEQMALRYLRQGLILANRVDDQAEIARLKAELRRVSEERDILKKAAVYFAKDHG